jgi:hypothetical protein
VAAPIEPVHIKELIVQLILKLKQGAQLVPEPPALLVQKKLPLEKPAPQQQQAQIVVNQVLHPQWHASCKYAIIFL